METMLLMGAEKVEQAGRAMQSAAETMKLAASTMAETTHGQRFWMEEWLARFENAVEKLSEVEERSQHGNAISPQAEG